MSSIDFNGPNIAPTEVIGVLNIRLKKITPSIINILLDFFVFVRPYVSKKGATLQ